nr:zinc finger, CCHC-type [Tanacetum cinerariifolium]
MSLFKLQNACLFSNLHKLTTPMLEDGGDNPTVEPVMKRAKWDNDDYVFRGLILNCNNVAGPSVVTMVEHNNSFRKLGHLKKDCKGVNVGNKANSLGTKGSLDGSSNSLKESSIAPKDQQSANVEFIKLACYIFNGVKIESSCNLGGTAKDDVGGWTVFDLQMALKLTRFFVTDC